MKIDNLRELIGILEKAWDLVPDDDDDLSPMMRQIEAMLIKVQRALAYEERQLLEKGASQ